MNNPFTTVVGYAIIGIVAIYVLFGWGIGNPMPLKDLLSELVTALAGLGLVLSRDGGH
jgi:hypothetical protein